MNDWHRREISDIVLLTGTDINYGRKISSPDKKRKKNNKVFILPSADPASILRTMASDAALPLLVVAYFISIFLGNLQTGVVGILLISSAFLCAAYIKYRSSLRIANSYRILLPEAKLIENGVKTRLSVYDVEIGDLITFAQGDIIPADARLVDSSQLFVAERELNEFSGRSEYKKHQKDHTFVSNDPDEIHCPNMVYAGSMVISGRGSAIVSAIGRETLICRNHNGISVVPQDDRPEFLNSFLKKSRRFSLLALILSIPIILVLIYFQSLRGDTEMDFLSMFILALAVAATSMSELSISSAEAIITKELLPSSLVSKVDKQQQSKITKISDAEKLSDTDTFLILCPETFIDERQLVRRVYFSGKQYRFDALNSEQIKDFSEQIFPFYLYMQPSVMTENDRIISRFLGSRSSNIKKTYRAKFLKNYPIKGAYSCIYEFDDSGNPTNYITRSTDVSLIRSCVAFRTDGGSLWKLDSGDITEIHAIFDKYSSSTALTPVAFFSYNHLNKGLIFEGIIAVGEEYPYSNGELADDLFEAGIHPVLVLEEENKRNIEIAYNCGLYKDNNDIAICSEYQKAGLGIKDAHQSAKIFVGFGRKGTQSISVRLSENSKKVLPIIKDSANRRDVAPFDIYATHSQKSFDSVKIASSVSIISTVSDKVGGVSDALKAVQACSIAFLKLGIYKNYLVFSAILRILMICIPLIAGYSNNVMNPIALLICGLFGDFLALLSVAHFKGVPVKAKNTISETRKLFYPSASFLCAFCSFIMSCIILCVIGYLTRKQILSSADAASLTSIFVLSVQFAAIGGFLLILHSRTRSHKFNLCYCLFAFLLVLIITIIFIPDIGVYFGIVSPIYMSLPYLLAVTACAPVVIVLLVGNLSLYSSTKRI